MRQDVSLECTECKSENYRTARNREQRDKLALRKHCPTCRKHTEHREKK